MSNKVQALMVWVYRDGMGDCTNGGISSKYEKLFLIGDGVEGPFTVDMDNPPENVVVLVKRRIFGREEYLHVEPLDGCNANKMLGGQGGKWYMDGGNIAYSCDSRFPNRYPLKIHDRYEGNN